MIIEATGDTSPCVNVPLTVSYSPTIDHTSANLQRVT